MQKKMRLTGIITQGASRMGSAEYIKHFKVSASFDGKTFTTYRADGQRKDKVRRFAVSQLYFTLPNLFVFAVVAMLAYSDLTKGLTEQLLI